MLIIHCSFTRKSLLVSTWFLSPWLGETANNYFRLFGENILSEETEKVGRKEEETDWLQDQFEGMTYEEIAVWVKQSDFV